VTSLSNELLNGAFPNRQFSKDHDSALLAVSFFIYSFIVFKKKLTLKIHGAAPGGDQRKLTYFEVRHAVAASYNYYVNKE